MTILTSGTGLGVYLPALFIQRGLAGRGVRAEVEVIEGYYTDEALARHRAFEEACRESFSLALMAHRMARGVHEHLDAVRVDELLRRWAGEARTRFIVWSGFWLPVLERYRGMVDAPLDIDRCRIDAEVSASFRAHADLAADANEIWLWSWAEKKTAFELSGTDRPPRPYAGRARRLVVHGGGWGIGTYRARLAELEPTDWALDVVVNERKAAPRPRAGDRAFIVDPAWRPWHRGPDGHGFPPLGEVGAGATAGVDHHALLELIANAKAIVSKPGGGTLMDSLSTATPVVLLEPYGYAEASNGALWEHLGFGISYARWRETRWSEQVLEELHQNLLRRPHRGPDYVHAYADRVLGRVTT